MKRLFSGIILLFLCAPSYAEKGDLAVIGFSTLNLCPIVILTTKNIPGNAIYTLTDKGWGNNAFSGGEGNLYWTAPPAGVPENTVVTILSNTTAGYSGGGGNATIGTVVVSSNMNIFAAYENLYIYEGNTPPVDGNDLKWVWALTLSSWTPGSGAGLTGYDLPAALNGYSWASGQAGAYEMYYTGSGSYASSVNISGSRSDIITALTDKNLFYKGNSPSVGATPPQYSIGATPLPLSLLSFGATCTNEGITCSWQTADERNVAFMQIERSANGRDFESVTTVQAHNLAGNHSYEAIDKTPYSGRSYYRLATTNSDGSVQCSQATVVIVNGQQQAMGLQVFPNPVQHAFTLIHSAATAGARLIIRGVDGRLVTVRPAEAGSTTTHFSDLDLPHGSYIASFENNGRVVTALLVK